MKYLNSATFLASTLMTTATLAVEPIADTWSFGFGYRDVATGLPSKSNDIDGAVFDSSSDVDSLMDGLAAMAEYSYSDHLSVKAEVTSGLSKASSSNTSSSITILSDATLETLSEEESYESELNYSMSLIALYRPLGLTPFRPFVLAGINSTSISYDYSFTQNGSTLYDESGDYTSTGLAYGVGFEFFMWKTLEFQFDYQALLHMEEETVMLASTISYSF